MNNLKDYFSSFDFLKDPEKRNNVITIIIAVIIVFVPIHYARKWTTYTNYNNSVAAQNYQQAKKINARTKKDVASAKIQLKNQPQIQKTIEKHVTEFLSAQAVLNDYKKKNTAVTPQAYDDATAKTLSMITNKQILNDPNHNLITMPGYTNGLTVTVSYSPSYNVYSKTINVVFHYNEGNKPIYIVNGTYDLGSNRFNNFDVFSTSYTYDYTNHLTAKDKARLDRIYDPRTKQKLAKDKKKAQQKEHSKKKQADKEKHNTKKKTTKKSAKKRKGGKK